MATLNFVVTTSEDILIHAIAKRASKLPRLKKYNFMALNMDIIACHSNGNPLKLQELRDADDFNFSHDILGIVFNLDRDTGKLDNCFSPRSSA